MRLPAHSGQCVPVVVISVDDLARLGSPLGWRCPSGRLLLESVGHSGDFFRGSMFSVA